MELNSKQDLLCYHLFKHRAAVACRENYKVLVDVVSYLVFYQNPLSAAETREGALHSVWSPLPGLFPAAATPFPPKWAAFSIFFCKRACLRLVQCTTLTIRFILWKAWAIGNVGQMGKHLEPKTNFSWMSWHMAGEQKGQGRLLCLTSAAHWFFSFTVSMAGSTFFFLFLWEDKVDIATDLCYRPYTCTSLLQQKNALAPTE